jgi:hypothetical protein
MFYAGVDLIRFIRGFYLLVSAAVFLTLALPLHLRNHASAGSSAIALAAR